MRMMQRNRENEPQNRTDTFKICQNICAPRTFFLLSVLNVIAYWIPQQEHAVSFKCRRKMPINFNEIIVNLTSHRISSLLVPFQLHDRPFRGTWVFSLAYEMFLCCSMAHWIEAVRRFNDNVQKQSKLWWKKNRITRIRSYFTFTVMSQNEQNIWLPHVILHIEISSRFFATAKESVELRSHGIYLLRRFLVRRFQMPTNQIKRRNFDSSWALLFSLPS